MSEPVTVTPHTLSDDELKDIGRLVRAFAEIEDIVAVHLCQVGSLNEGQLAVLVGRLGISQRVKMAEQFAKGLGGAAWEAWLRDGGVVRARGVHGGRANITASDLKTTSSINNQY